MAKKTFRYAEVKPSVVVAAQTLAADIVSGGGRAVDEDALAAALKGVVVAFAQGTPHVVEANVEDPAEFNLSGEMIVQAARELASGGRESAAVGLLLQAIRHDSFETLAQAIEGTNDDALTQITDSADLQALEDEGGSTVTAADDDYDDEDEEYEYEDDEDDSDDDSDEDDSDDDDDSSDEDDSDDEDDSSDDDEDDSDDEDEDDDEDDPEPSDEDDEDDDDDDDDADDDYDETASVARHAERAIRLKRELVGK